MSAAETILVVLAVGAAVGYLLRRARLYFGRSGGGCCGRCPVAPRRSQAP